MGDIVVKIPEGLKDIGGESERAEHLVGELRAIEEGACRALERH